MHQGIFLAIEGSDGSGKTTQFRLLVERLKSAGYDVETIKFPRYSEESSHFVRKYLDGSYGTANQLGPYTPSLFYALDRFDAAPQVSQWLSEGKIVITDRYSGANKAHHGQKISDTATRHAYYKWVDQLEFDMLGIARPDLNLVLTVPSDIAIRLIQRRGDEQKADIHDLDPDHVRQASEAYLELCQLYPKEFVDIECAKNNELMSISAINNLIWERIEPMLGRLRKKTKNEAAEVKEHVFAPKQDDQTAVKQLKVPGTLDGKLREQYEHYLQLLQTNSIQIVKLLKDSSPEAVKSITTALNPIGETKEPLTLSSELSDLVSKRGLVPIKGNADQLVTLLDHWPKNELEVLPLGLYPYSTLSLKDLSREISSWSYSEKENALMKLLKNQEISQASYHLEFLTSYHLHQQINQLGEVSAQSLTPFYGYDQLAPKGSSEAELLIEQCFDASMDMYKNLSVAGLPKEAAGVCLSGHKLRWQNSLNLIELHRLTALLKFSELGEAAQILNMLMDAVSEGHPIITSSLLAN